MSAAVSVCIQFKVKHANVGLRLRKGVSPICLPPNSIQRCKYWLCALCTHWRMLTVYIFKGECINGRFALILCLFADLLFIQQLHTDKIVTSGLLTIIHVNQLLHGNISERASQKNVYFTSLPGDTWSFYVDILLQNQHLVCTHKRFVVDTHDLQKMNPCYFFLTKSLVSLKKSKCVTEISKITGSTVMRFTKHIHGMSMTSNSYNDLCM